MQASVMRSYSCRLRRIVSMSWGDRASQRSRTSLASILVPPSRHFKSVDYLPQALFGCLTYYLKLFRPWYIDEYPNAITCTHADSILYQKSTWPALRSYKVLDYLLGLIRNVSKSVITSCFHDMHSSNEHWKPNTFKRSHTTTSRAM